MAKPGSPRENSPAAPRVARARPRDDATTAPDATIEDGSQRRHVVGVRLINMSRKALIDRGLPDRHIADLMGVSAVYWNSMTNGNRRISSLPKEKLRHLAEFLQIPLIQVYVLAGHFGAEDFAVYRSLMADVDRMMDFMRTDPKWLALAPSKHEWDELPQRTKVLVATLYEAISHKSFLHATKIEVPEA
jgi:transcriptional regulator with XRE-family HTH domain